MEQQHSARDSVAALVREDQTAHVLATVHRSGHGHHARLIREQGAMLADRLRRCGVPPGFQSAASDGQDVVVLIVDAPHQAIQVSELLLGLGALRVERFQAASVSSAVLTFDRAALGERRSRNRSDRHPAR